VLLEEVEDVIERVKCDFAGKSIRQNSYSNHDRNGNNCSIWGNLNVNILDVLVVLTLFIILILLNSAKTNKVNK